jgi:hypothetical protein
MDDTNTEKCIDCCGTGYTPLMWAMCSLGQWRLVKHPCYRCYGTGRMQRRLSLVQQYERAGLSRHEARRAVWQLLDPAIRGIEDVA